MVATDAISEGENLQDAELMINYDLSWILLTFLGWLGIHRFYMGKIFTGILYLLSAGLLGVGILWDFLTLNEQISEVNTERGQN